MKIAQILNETDIKTSVIDDIMDLLLVYKQAGLNKINVKGSKGILIYLHNLGHTVDKETLITVLDDPIFDEVIERSDQNEITLKGAELDSTIAPDEKALSQDKVDKTAAKVAKQEVKAGDKI